MATDRREFMKVVGATAAAVGAMLASGAASAAETADRIKNIKAFAFDAYGTLFDVFSVTALCEQLFPGKGGRGAGGATIEKGGTRWETKARRIRTRLGNRR